MPSLRTRTRARDARVAAVGANCWDAPVAIQERVDKLCASDGYTGKYVARTAEGLLTNTAATFRFTAPGAFCPKHMLVFAFNSATGAVVEVDQSLITFIKVGIEQQILPIGPRSVGGFPAVPAQMFSITNACCQVFCPPCVCAPQVPFEVGFSNGEGVTLDVTIILIGEYLDIPPDQFRFNQPPVAPECCPPPSSDKLLGFGTALAPAESRTLSLTVGGQFCPRQLFLATFGLSTVVINGIRSGLDENIITGPIPPSLFTVDNKCCILECFKCICAPGYPIQIDVTNTHPENAAAFVGAFVGCYTDACPPGA
jgi:hypothetical protein